MSISDSTVDLHEYGAMGRVVTKSEALTAI